MLVNANLASTYLKIPKSAFDDADLLDPLLNHDSLHYIDPLLLKASSVPSLRNGAYNDLLKTLREIVDLVGAAQRPNDPAWKAAVKRLDLSEIGEIGLGYGVTRTTGSSAPESDRQQIVSTTKEIMALGVNNPNLILLMAFIEPGIGADRLGDLTGNIIVEYLADISEKFFALHRAPTQDFIIRGRAYKLPLNPFTNSYILTVPKDILKPLPKANDRSEIDRVARENAEIRDRYSQLLGNAARASVTTSKRALRKIVLSSKHSAEAVVQALLVPHPTYDPNADLWGFYAFKDVLNRTPADFSDSGVGSGTEPLAVVHAICRMFKQLVEQNNLYELLWFKNEPRYERAAQLVFFAVAQMFCKQNNIDVSPETNMGGGPVDFKFSRGHKAKVIVELKLSHGTVEAGYRKQLPRYQDAAPGSKGVFVVIDVGNLRKKLASIQEYRAERVSRGEEMPDIYYVDARKKPSASKLKV